MAHTTLTAPEGSYLYNGKHVVSVIYAPQGADLSEWKEITKEEGDAIRAEHAKARQEAQEKAKAEAEAKREQHKAEAEAKRAEREKEKNND